MSLPGENGSSRIFVIMGFREVAHMTILQESTVLYVNDDGIEVLGHIHQPVILVLYVMVSGDGRSFRCVSYAYVIDTSNVSEHFISFRESFRSLPMF